MPLAVDVTVAGLGCRDELRRGGGDEDASITVAMDAKSGDPEVAALVKGG